MPNEPAPADPDPVRPPPVEPARPFAFAPLQTTLPVYRLEVSDAALAQVMADVSADVEVDATFVAGDARFPAKVSLRGASSRYFPKRSWNVDLGTARLDGRGKLSLIAEYQDATLMAEKLAYDLLEAMGARASHASYVQLYLNGKYEGVFLDLERVDKALLKRTRFADPDATIWRCGWRNSELKLRSWKAAYQGDWSQKTNELSDPGFAALDQVLWTINRTPDPQLPAALDAALDTDQLMKTLAMDALMSNDFVEDSESYFIHDKVANRWSYLPWDLNNVDARWWYEYPLNQGPGCGGGPGWCDWTSDQPVTDHPLFIYSLLDGWVQDRYDERKQYNYPDFQPNFSNLATRVALNPVLRARAIAALERALDTLFTEAVMDARIDQTYALIAPAMLPDDGDALADPYMDPAKFREGPKYLKNFVRGRIAFVRQQLARLRGFQPTLAISAFDPRANWIEVTNRGATPFDLSTVVVTKHLRKSLASLSGTNASLPATQLAAGKTLRIDLGPLGLTADPDGELGLFDGRTVTGFYDLAFYGAPATGAHYQRAADFGWAFAPN